MIAKSGILAPAEAIWPVRMSIQLSRRHFLAGCAASLVSPAVARARTDDPRQLALRGMDAVAYFTEDRALKGATSHALLWRGRVWHFVSLGNLERFMADPYRYMPQYGGACAWHMVVRQQMPGNPTVFDVVDRRLFLHHSSTTQQAWQRNAAAYIRVADARWRSLTS